MLITIAFLILGLAVLVFAGEFLVKGAVNIANHFNVSPLIIGMTIVSFGTSAPELFVSIKGALTNHSDVSLGNVVGSNIANLGLVLGLTALIIPLPVKRNTVKIDWPVMMLASILLFVFLYDNFLSRIDAIVLLTVLIVYLGGTIRSFLHKRKLEEKHEPTEQLSIPKQVLFIAVGVVGLVFGAKWLVESAVEISLYFGISERVVGLTVVAFGTSVPELATSVIAALKKEADISLGNLVGSNLFNISSILGITGIIQPMEASSEMFTFDLPWMLAISVVAILVVFPKYEIKRWGGAVLLLLYGVYIYGLL